MTDLYPRKQKWDSGKDNPGIGENTCVVLKSVGLRHAQGARRTCGVHSLARVSIQLACRMLTGDIVIPKLFFPSG